MAGVVILVLASTKPGLEPFQDPGVPQLHLQPRGSHLEDWNFFLVPKYHPYNILHHETVLPRSIPTRFFPFLWSKMTENGFLARKCHIWRFFIHIQLKFTICKIIDEEKQFSIELVPYMTFSCQKSHFQSFLTIKTEKTGRNGYGRSRFMVQNVVGVIFWH